LGLMLRFGIARGASVKEMGRLFYYGGLKPPLAFRGWTAYSSGRLLQFRIRAAKNLTFRVWARDNGLDVNTLAEFFSSQYEFIPPELPPIKPKVIYDLGANIGAASLFLAARYPAARFYGFEPLPANYEVCVKNYQNLPQSRVFPWAIGARSGTASFEFSEGDVRGGRIGASLSPLATRSGTRIDVPVFSLAKLIRTKQVEAPDFLKIDVEGAEAEVLRGLEDQLDSIKRVLVETHGSACESECLRWFLDHGFVVRHLHEAALGFTAIWCDRA
jgi:FkbM family methyltransferase